MPDIEQRQIDQPAYATAAVVAGATTVSEITITVRNSNGQPKGPVMLYVYLSDSTVGAGLTAATASGTVACKTAGTLGTDISVLVAKKALLVQTLANGTYVLSITDAAKTAFKICCQIDDVSQVVTTLATASYGP
jgi:hypothetical protein